MLLLPDRYTILLLPQTETKLLYFPNNLNCTMKTLTSRQNIGSCMVAAPPPLLILGGPLNANNVMVVVSKDIILC